MSEPRSAQKNRTAKRALRVRLWQLADEILEQQLWAWTLLE